MIDVLLSVNPELRNKKKKLTFINYNKLKIDKFSMFQNHLQIIIKKAVRHKKVYRYCLKNPISSLKLTE